MYFRPLSQLTLRVTSIATFSLLLLALFVSPASAQTAERPVVRAVLFISPICTFCRQIVERDLPPVIQEFGEQLQIVYVDINTPEGESLYEAALKAFNVPRGTPLLFIGQTTLAGINITPQLPALVETYLAQGGLDWPAIPGLAEYLTPTQEAAVQLTSLPEINSNPLSQTTEGESVVRAVMFWISDCSHCEDVIQNVLPAVREKYGSQFELMMIEVVSAKDIEELLAVAASYNIPKEETGVPFMIIGDKILVGSDQVRDQLSTMIDEYLAEGGVDWPSNPLLQEHLATALLNPPSNTSLPINVSSTSRNNGFALAIAIMIGMAIALLYSIVVFVSGKTFFMPRWADWLIPFLIVLGIGVAGYLSYVETQSVEAICGPVGDCNTVQQSRYAKLFDILPIGVLGLVGYVALLVSWLARRYVPKFEKPAAIGFFGMAFFAVLFSLYLTYLEPFVIRAVCIWCLSSAVIVTFLLLLGVPPVARQFSVSDEDE